METNQNLTRKIVVRPGTSNDMAVCIPIYYEAFSRIDAQHNFPAEIPNQKWGKNILDYLFTSGLHFLVAEMDGRIVGGNFIDERSQIAGVGPIFVSPDVQHLGIGRMLMDAVINRQRDRKLEGIRLLQASFNLQSLSLYAKLGFIVREPVAVMAGVPLRERTAPGCTFDAQQQRILH
jgi:GNAT superfamily N-acetyltransferase